jgi:hypothetical protein
MVAQQLRMMKVQLCGFEPALLVLIAGFAVTLCLVWDVSFACITKRQSAESGFCLRILLNLKQFSYQAIQAHALHESGARAAEAHQP